MRLKTIHGEFHKQLDAIYGLEEVTSFFYLLTEAYVNFTRLQLAIEPDKMVSKEKETLFLNALSRLKKEEPIQYIIGETHFYGLPFKVNKHTLIPRPETEELVSWVLDYAKKKDLTNPIKNKPITILDIGTGTGCIAVSVAKNLPNAQVYALDVSKEALKVAKYNANLNNVNISFIEADILCETSWTSTFSGLNFDIIVSNPPYVRELEKHKMEANVLNNEPHLALFVKNDNALQFYEAITYFAENYLINKGALFYEINEYLAEETLELLKRNDFAHLELKQDIFAKDRMLKGIKK